MGINAVKGVSIGDGFDVVTQKGSEHRDELTPDGFKSNHAGGVLGGISSGQPVVARLALKPTSSIQVPGDTIDINGQPAEVITTGRHDPVSACAPPRSPKPWSPLCCWIMRCASGVKTAT